MSPPAWQMVRPILEVLAATALFWLAIGFLDRPSTGVDVLIRNCVVAAWAIVVLWRFLLPLLRTRGQRFVVTNRRIVALSGTSNKVDSIPLAQIRSVHCYRGGLNVGLIGYPAPVYFKKVGRVRRVEELINRQLQ
ncbi:hypothetical protein KIP68_03715 [Corynebacterium aquatimens]